MRSILSVLVLAVLFVLNGCVSVHRGVNGELEAAARAVTPRGAAVVIDASARYTLAEAQAACMVNPSQCGWLFPFEAWSATPGARLTDWVSLQQSGMTQAMDSRGATLVIDRQLLLELEKVRVELERSRADFRVILESGE
ncbi:MAG: hypothetical protein WC702_03565 [Patescibacteria group bacterium]|jgi:hypothetical protein